MNTKQTLSLGMLISLVVGSMIGGGIFTLPSVFGQATGGLGAIIAWIIAGLGMLMLALVFQSLAIRKPNLDSGIYAYANAGFGSYMGFISALGFWAAACVGNLSYFLLTQSTLGFLTGYTEFFGEGNTLGAIACSSVLLWFFHILLLNGIKEAAFINTLVTIAKIIPIVVFIFTMCFIFDYQVFINNFWGSDLTEMTSPMNTSISLSSLYDQISSTMLITVFVFLGVEGASIYSRYAKKRQHVGMATVLGFIGVLCLLIMVTLLPYGVMSRAELAQISQPSMVTVMEHSIGSTAARLLSMGLIISVLGAYLSWSLLAAEIIFIAAKNESMPRFLTRINKKQVPALSVWMTNLFIQTMLWVAYLSDYALRLALDLTSSLSLIPYLLVSGYALKLALTGDSYTTQETSARYKHGIIALVAVAYSALMIYSGGLKYILLSTLIYAPLSLLFILAKVEQKRSIFGRVEQLVFLILWGLAIVAAIKIITHQITI